MNNLNLKYRDLNKKTKNLRSQGFVPGSLYGPSISSIPVKMEKHQLNKNLLKTGEIYKIRSKTGTMMVKFAELQNDPVTNEIIHFSLLQMPKGVMNEVEIPINFEGTPVGVRKGGVFVVMKDEVTVSGKPSSVPNVLTANVNNIDIGDKVTLNDLNFPEKVGIEEDGDELLAICKPPAKEIEVEENEDMFETEKQRLDDFKIKLEKTA